MRGFVFGLVAPLALLVGCSSGPTTSTVSGTIDEASFSSRVAKVTVVDDAGKSTSAAVASDGMFKVTLNEGSHYQLFLGADGKSVPVVTNSADMRLETQIDIESGGASADLGVIRYRAGVDTIESKSTSVVVPSGVAPATSCAKGLIVGTSTPCTSSAATVVCAGDDGHDHHDDFDHHDDDHDHGDFDHDHGDDHMDHGDSFSADPATDAISSESVGIPEFSVTALSCGCVGM